MAVSRNTEASIKRLVFYSNQSSTVFRIGHDQEPLDCFGFYRFAACSKCATTSVALVAATQAGLVKPTVK
ncbi:hypothetical protein OESDEN_15855 [Oesophagostomum dentatum]|uniref:Uncharacterized protein n=1 Tax=Oesophagostomum dentatum TaxID=61180 RepID=A0A0B1SKL1_OESDE|nr:hypothetical protein OESDEN_15855 [Oesophagostomum dentatum]